MPHMKPQRIASLLASSTEILYGLGLGEKVVAISHECDFPPEVVSKPRVTCTHVSPDTSSIDIDQQVTQYAVKGLPLYSIDVELLASLRPDLIVTQGHCEVCAVSYDDVLRATRDRAELRATVVVSISANTLKNILQDITRIGEAVQCPIEAQRYVANLQNRIDTVKLKTDARAEAHRPRVACLEWLNPVMVAANWMPDLIHLAGGRNELTESGTSSGYTNWEEVVAYDPEVIILMPCGFDLKRTLEEIGEVTKLPNWSKLAAVKTERVYAVDGNAYFNRSGPRIVDSLEILAELIHPDVFGDATKLRQGVVARIGENSTYKISDRPSSFA